MKLREALETVKSSVIPGAITSDGKSYVWVDEETSERPYRYIPDLTSPAKDTYHLVNDQVDRLVLFAQQDIWVPVSNFIID
jgi:hypothetical protein